MLSASLYSIVAALVIPEFGPYSGAALAFCSCVALVTTPIAIGLEARKRRAADCAARAETICTNMEGESAPAIEKPSDTDTLHVAIGTPDGIGLATNDMCSEKGR
eukprot:TRINITY_DN34280_c0_g1_i1.p1 TRINITY_DN34280_c0_g1~~TRINITY_DN34280_c0_g1_i1.p1  ORF type:complete len:105 (+),score=20.75 TRINITY_DN34280_c0_g1_i1:373-687(+)